MSWTMPMYEFHCLTCDRGFSLALSDSQEKPHACPGCGSKDVERVTETEAVTSEKR